MEQILWQPWTLNQRLKQIARDPEKITTYRKGTKWLRPELVGQRVELAATQGGQVFATATVISVKAARFSDIDEIDHQRQSSDITPEGRLKVMQSVYEGFNEDTITTIVTLGEIRETLQPGICAPVGE